MNTQNYTGLRTHKVHLKMMRQDTLVGFDRYRTLKLQPLLILSDPILTKKETSTDKHHIHKIPQKL